MFKTPEKLTDKTFTRLILFSFIGMFICLMCLCSVTWAWFVDSTESSSNTITSAGVFSLSVIAEDEGADGSIRVSLDAAEQSFEAENVVLDAGKYTVTMTLPAESSSGYLVISDGVDEYYSPTLIRSENNEEQKISFTLDVKAVTTLSFKAKWGIYSGDPSVEASGTLVVD